MRVLDGRYRLDVQVGRGGMAVVWRAYDLLLRRTIAVKTLPSAAQPEARERIYAEARAVASLNHAHIAAIYDLGEYAVDARPPVPYLVMEYVGGGSLQRHLAEHGRLDPVAAARVCSQVAAALSAAHEFGIVHRDVKPANVMFGSGGVKVVDFGIAAAVGQVEADGSGPLLGTPAYMAPEHLDGGEVTAASDVYGLGLLLYRCLTGVLPWPAADAYQMIMARRHEPFAELPADEELPWELVRVCNLCLQVDPLQRPASRDAARLLAVAAARTATARLRRATPRRQAWSTDGTRPVPSPTARVMPPAGAPVPGPPVPGPPADAPASGPPMSGSPASGSPASSSPVSGPPGDAPVSGPPTAALAWPDSVAPVAEMDATALVAEMDATALVAGLDAAAELEPVAGFDSLAGLGAVAGPAAGGTPGLPPIRPPVGASRHRFRPPSGAFPALGRRRAVASVALLAVLGAVVAGVASQLPGRLLSHAGNPPVVLPTGTAGCGPACQLVVPPPPAPAATSPTSPASRAPAPNAAVPPVHPVAATTPGTATTSTGRPRTASPSPVPASSGPGTPTPGPPTGSPTGTPTPGPGGSASPGPAA